MTGFAGVDARSHPFDMAQFTSCGSHSSGKISSRPSRTGSASSRRARRRFGRGRVKPEPIVDSKWTCPSHPQKAAAKSLAVPMATRHRSDHGAAIDFPWKAQPCHSAALPDHFGGEAVVWRELRLNSAARLNVYLRLDKGASVRDIVKATRPTFSMSSDDSCPMDSANPRISTALLRQLTHPHLRWLESAPG